MAELVRDRTAYWQRLKDSAREWVVDQAYRAHAAYTNVMVNIVAPAMARDGRFAAVAAGPADATDLVCTQYMYWRAAVRDAYEDAMVGAFLVGAGVASDESSAGGTPRRSMSKKDTFYPMLPAWVSRPGFAVGVGVVAGGAILSTQVFLGIHISRLGPKMAKSLPKRLPLILAVAGKLLPRNPDATGEAEPTSPAV